MSIFRGLVACLSCALAYSGTLYAGITFDASSHSTTVESSSITWDHTVGSGADRVLVVGIASVGSVSLGLSEASSVTYNGITMSRVTAAYQYNQVGFGAPMATDLWYLLSPPQGTASISVSFGGDVKQILAGAVSLTNVLQESPSIAGGDQYSTFGISTDVTTTEADTWLVDIALFNSLEGMTPTSGQTELFQEQSTSASAAMGARLVASPGLTSSSWYTGNPFGATGVWSLSVVGFAPVPEPSSAMLATCGIAVAGGLLLRSRNRKPVRAISRT